MSFAHDRDNILMLHLCASHHTLRRAYILDSMMMTRNSIFDKQDFEYLGMMLIMVNSQRSFSEMRLESIVFVGQRWQFDRHCENRKEYEQAMRIYYVGRSLPYYNNKKKEAEATRILGSGHWGLGRAEVGSG